MAPADQLGRLAAWRGGDVTVVADDVPGGGYSAELLFVRVDDRPMVVRLAPGDGPALFPDTDLEMQAAVQEAAGAAGVPVAAPVAHEPDPSWLGRPFLVAPRIAGRHPGDAPALTPWVTELAVAGQRALHGGFLDALAAVHAMDPTPLAGVLRDATDLAAEVSWWEGYAEWACTDGGASVSPEPLLDLFARCRAQLPSGPAAPASVLWGDVRMGNVVVGDDLRPAAILDWEMATIGPAEADLAWLTTLDAMTEHFIGQTVPGFLGCDEVIAHHEARLGRPLQDMAWHEGFAVARAASTSVRTAIVAALRKGKAPSEPATHAVVAYAWDRLAGG